jgi:hypothetical protein
VQLAGAYAAARGGGDGARTPLGSVPPSALGFNGKTFTGNAAAPTKPRPR